MRPLPAVVLLAFGALTSCSAILGLREPAILDGSVGDASFGDAEGGACGKDCLGGQCASGQCQPVLLAGNQGGPFMVAEYGSRVFWTDLLGNTVGVADKIDGSPGIFASNADNPIGIAADDSGVYVASSGSSGTVLHCDPAGCSSQSVIYDAGFTNTDLALSGGYVYWLQADGDALDRMVKAGGSAQMLATTDTNNSQRFLARIATDGSYVYWSETFNDKILREQIGGATSQAIYTFPANSAPSALHIDSGTLYMATFGASNGQGTVSYGKLDGSGGAQALAASQHYPYAIATDSTFVYWTTEGDIDGTGKAQGNGGVFRCAKGGCGGNPDQLASNLVDTRGIAVDDRAIYFVTFETGNGDGKVWRLAK